MALPRSRSRRRNRNSASILKRQERVFDLKSQGMTNQDIAEMMQVSDATISNDLKIVATLKHEGLIEKETLLIASIDHIHQKILKTWLPIALSTKLVVGEVKTRPNGQEYDIELKDWEAGVSAVGIVQKTLDSMAKNHGIQNPKAPAISPTEFGEHVGTAVLSIFQKMAQQRTPIQATIIDNEPTATTTGDSSGTSPGP